VKKAAKSEEKKTNKSLC